ncbi:MipA/OmpV family protein [Pseudomonas sp. NFIX28]|uniref:MipA/OmpV family protein n=1 Tax=Pseudomonas sp. NFIX28 TaxID=1566235 RepID=UPI00089BB930|nr:MipA/OmpV family protein [Pseudomonas sp. NFIX28]SDZ68498.1 Outer membrane scaffolding protein for murein synthesis, MipA/OmpV family [Pseudomonas sp. NFIX28]
MKTSNPPKTLGLSLAALPVASLCLLAPGTTLYAADWQYQLQAGVASLPRYSGSDERSVAPLLGGEIASPYGVFLNTEQGLGWRNEWGDLAFGAWVGPSAARKDRKHGYKGSDHLDGMGSIKSRAQFGAHLGYTLGAVELGATLQHALKKNDDPDTGSAYNHLQLSIASTLYEGRYGRLDGSLNSQFGDGDYLRTWYGVSNAQAGRTRFDAYRPKGGFLSRGGDLTWTVPIDDQLQVATVLAVQYLGREAADSPIVERRLQTSLAIALEYSL